MTNPSDPTAALPLRLDYWEFDPAGPRQIGHFTTADTASPGAMTRFRFVVTHDPVDPPADPDTTLTLPIDPAPAHNAD